MAILNTNNAESDRTPRFAASDLDLYCCHLPFCLVSRLNWVKKNLKKLVKGDFNITALKAPYSSQIDILLSKKGLINRYMILIQSLNVAPESL